MKQQKKKIPNQEFTKISLKLDPLLPRDRDVASNSCGWAEPKRNASSKEKRLSLKIGHVMYICCTGVLTLFHRI